MKSSAIVLFAGFVSAGVSFAGGLTTTYLGFDPKNSQNDLIQAITYQAPNPDWLASLGTKRVFSTVPE